MLYVTDTLYLQVTSNFEFVILEDLCKNDTTSMLTLQFKQSDGYYSLRSNVISTLCRHTKFQHTDILHFLLSLLFTNEFGLCYSISHFHVTK